MYAYKTSDQNKRSASQSRASDCRHHRASNLDNANPSRESTIRREAVAEFALECRKPGNWRFEGDHLMPVLLTMLPAWRSSGLSLEILQDGRNPVVFGSDNEDRIVRPVIRLRRLNENHYRAVIDGADVEVGADGNCFFYSIWYALETSVSPEIRQRIYGNRPPDDRIAASDFFRNQIGDYCLNHEDEIADFLAYRQPRTDFRPDSVKIKIDTASVDPADTTDAAPDDSPAYTVPFAVTEIARSLFHTGKSLSSAIGWSLLLADGIKTVYQWIPLSYWPSQVYFLYDLLRNKQDYFSALIKLLSLVPYNLLASDLFLFSLADAARQIYYPLLSGMHDLPPFFWTAVGALALVTHYTVYAQQNVELPQTGIGQAITLFLQQMRHIPQIYGLLETIHSSHSSTPLLPLVKDDRMIFTAEEIQAMRLERKAAKADALSSRARSRSLAQPRLGQASAHAEREMQFVDPTAFRLPDASQESLSAAPSGGSTSSIALGQTAAVRTGDIANPATDFNADTLAPAALEAIANVTDPSRQESNSESFSIPATHSEGNAPSNSPHQSATSQASQKQPFVALCIPLGAAAAAQGLMTGIWPPDRRTVVLTAFTIVTVTVITAYFVQLGLTISGESDDTEQEILQADAQPLAQKRGKRNADMHTPNLKWTYLKGRNLDCLNFFIANRLDYHFFENSLVRVFSSGDIKSGKPNKTTVYETAVRSAYGDFISDTQVPLNQRSSEDRYGPNFYWLLDWLVNNENENENKNADQKEYYSCNFRSPDALELALVKIKAYETFILRAQRSLHFDTREGIVSKLESVFGLPILLSEIEISERILDDYIKIRLGDNSTTLIPDEVVKGVSTAISLWSTRIMRYLNEGSGIPETVIYLSRHDVSEKIKQEKEELYKNRGPLDQDNYIRHQKNIAEYRYAALYLENLIKISHNFLDVLNRIKPEIHKIKPELKTLSDRLGDARVFYSRILATKAALKMLASQFDPLNSDNLSALLNLSDEGYLNNFQFISGSSREITAFVTLAEAIFYRILTTVDTDNLHLFAANPAQLVLDFRRAIEYSPIQGRNGKLATEGADFVRNIATNDQTFDDAEYYQQFLTFKKRYQIPLGKSISYSALSGYGMHPYSMLALKPRKIVQMTLFFRPKDPLTEMIFASLNVPTPYESYSKFLKDLSDENMLKFDHMQAGDLIFCEISDKEWIIISTLGGVVQARRFTTAQMNQNTALKNISLEQALELDWYPEYAELFQPVPEGSHSLWMNENLFRFVIRPIFGNDNSGIYEASIDKAYLFLDKYPDSKRRFAGKNILSIMDTATDDSLILYMGYAKQQKYRRAWWQYITMFIPGFDMIYQAVNDPDYNPGAGEITFEVVTSALTLISISIPVAHITKANIALLRASLVTNLLKGLRGKPLIVAVLAEVGPSLAYLPLRIMAIATYEIFAFWEPLPLDIAVFAIYQKLKFSKLIFKSRIIKSTSIPDNLQVTKLQPDITDTAKHGKIQSNEARGVLMSGNQNKIIYHDFTYSYEIEKLTGAGKPPLSGAADANKVKVPATLPDSRILNEDGAIELKPARAITRIETPFKYSRTDAGVLPKAVSSHGSDDRHLTFESIDQGIARDIEFHHQPFSPVSYVGEIGIDSNTEIVHLRDTADSVIGIRINLEDIAPDRALVITSGEMSHGTFIVGIDEADACAYFYRFGDMGSDSADMAVDNTPVRGLFETHNSLASRAAMRIPIPETVQKNDLIWFSRKFDKTAIIYRDDPGTSGFSVLDEDFDLSTQPGAKPSTSHSASSFSLDLLNFNHVSEDKNIIQRTANAYFMLSRKDREHVSIVGRSQYRGRVDPGERGSWQPGAEDGSVSKMAELDLKDIENLLVRSGNKVNAHARIPDTDPLKAVETTGKYFIEHGYNVKYRILVIWPWDESAKIIRHYSIIIEKNGRSYLVDIAAGRFSSQGINGPIFATDTSWRTQYITSFPSDATLIRDINSFDSLSDFAKAGSVRKNPVLELADPDWTVLNKPSWTLLKASEVGADISTDLVVDINAGRVQRGYSDLNYLKTIPPMPIDRATKWNELITDEEFTRALTGTPSSALKKIQFILKGKSIRSKILITKTYNSFDDENPTTFYAIQASLEENTVDIITLPVRPRRTVTTVPLESWQRANHHKITFFRLIEDPEKVPNFLDPAGVPDTITRSRFFDEMTDRYSLLHFDPGAIESLDNAIAALRTSISKYAGPYLNNDPRTENSILEKFSSADAGNEMNLRIQTTIVDEIANYQFLRGVLGRLEDLRGKIRAGDLADIHPREYVEKRMIGSVADLRVKEDNLFDKISIKKYDSTAGKYVIDPGFQVVRISDLKHLFGEVDVKIIFSQYLKTYREIYDMGIAYSIEGRFESGQHIVRSARIGIEMTERLIRHADLGYKDCIYVWIDKNNFNHKHPKAYGLSLVLHVFEKDEILHLDTVLEHPFTQLKDQDFLDYSIRHGSEWNVQGQAGYKTKGVGQFLSYHTAKKALAESDAKYFSVQVRNQRAESFAGEFNLKEINDLEFYGLDVSIRSVREARWSLLRGLLQAAGSRIKSKLGQVAESVKISGSLTAPGEIPSPSATAVKKAVRGRSEKLEEKWQREDISLGQEKPGGAGNKFEGIYSVPEAGTSTSVGRWKYYIKDEGNVYEVRPSDDARTWCIVDPLDPGTLGKAIPVRLDDTGHWVKRVDTPEKAGSPPSIVGRSGHLVNLSEPESREIRAVMKSARGRALDMIDDAIITISRKNTEDVNEAMDIFFGKHHDAAKDSYRESLVKIKLFLTKLDVIEDVSYQGGYFPLKSTLMYTHVNSALDNWKDGPPPILVSVDALADLLLKKKFTSGEFKNYVACVLIHESYHAVSSTAIDLKYAKLQDGAVDISEIVLFRGPWWFGDDDQLIMSKYGVSQAELTDLREQSYRRSRKNPDNLAYLTVLLSNLENLDPLYEKFITRYRQWITDPNTALEWKNEGYNIGGQLRLKTRTAIASFIGGNPEPLNQNGFLYRKSSGEIPVRFDVLTSESPELKKFSFEKNKFSHFLDTWKGGESTSQKNGVWLGTWGSEHYLNDDISVIEIRGEKSTVTAIRIDLNEIQEGHPLIISGGELEGSTIALALSDDGPRTYLLVFHAGYRADNPDWLPGQQGVAGIYRAHLAMAGEYITDWTISDTDTLVDGSGTTLGHHALDDILRLYKAGWVTYSGQLPNSSPGVTSAAPTIKWIDYAKGATGLAPAKGHAYALVTNIKGQWQIDLHAKLAPSLSVPDGTTQTRLKT